MKRIIKSDNRVLVLASAGMLPLLDLMEMPH